jgi:hypothetical protein
LHFFIDPPFFIIGSAIAPIIAFFILVPDLAFLTEAPDLALPAFFLAPAILSANVALL